MSPLPWCSALSTSTSSTWRIASTSTRARVASPLTISRRPLTRHRVLPVGDVLAAQLEQSQSTRSRSVWRASASRLLIVDSSRSSLAEALVEHGRRVGPRRGELGLDRHAHRRHRRAQLVRHLRRERALALRAVPRYGCGRRRVPSAANRAPRSRSDRAADRLLLGRESAHSLSSSIGRLRRLATSTPTAAATARIASAAPASRASDR